VRKFLEKKFRKKFKLGLSYAGAEIIQHGNDPQETTCNKITSIKIQN